jgi:ABC-type transport system substrate-binding protein
VEEILPVDEDHRALDRRFGRAHGSGEKITPPGPFGVSDGGQVRREGRYKDPVLDDLYVKQARAVHPEERKRHLRAFEKRLLDEEVHCLYTLQWRRIVPHSAKVRGWTITPAHFLNQQLDAVWLAE